MQKKSLDQKGGSKKLIWVKMVTVNENQWQRVSHDGKKIALGDSTPSPFLYLHFGRALMRV
jgi:hypothetical protein